MITANVKGLDELYRYFDVFPAKLQTKVLRGATRAGARIVAKEYKKRVPKRVKGGQKWLGYSRRYKTWPGFLKSEVTVWRRRKGISKQAVVYGAGVHTTRKQKPWPFYAVILERGTKDGRIKAGYYLKDTLDSTRGQVLEVMRRKTAQGIEKHMRAELQISRLIPFA